MRSASSNVTLGVRLALLATVVLLTNACGMLPGKSAVRSAHRYSLSAGLKQGAIESGSGGSESCLNAQVLLPKSAAGFNTARMAYLREPDRIEYFAHNQWVDTPAYMVQPLLVKALAKSGRFRHVVMAPSTVGKRFRLEADDLALVQQFEGDVNTVRLALRLRLVDVEKGLFLFDEVIALEKPAAQAGPVSGVATANELARDLMQRVTDTVQASVDLSTLCTP